MDHFKFILILYWVILGLYYVFFYESNKDFQLLPHNNNFPKTKKDSIELLERIVVWCHLNIIPIKKRRLIPQIEISMHAKGKTLGYYNYSTKTILIYLKRHDNHKDLVDTVIHEYVHHIQLRTGYDSRRYNKLTNQEGYKNNEYEIEARRVAKYLRDRAMKDLGL